MASDAPITRLTSLEFTPDGSMRYNGLFVPQLTPEEIANIGIDESRIGGIVYNTQTQELQYFAPTLQWVNILTEGSDGIFDDLTVLNNLTVDNLTTLHTTEMTSMTVGGTAFVGSLIGNVAVVGPRLGGSFVLPSSTSPALSITSTTTVFKIPGATTATSTNEFTMPASNRLQYTGTFQSPINVLVTGIYNATYSINSSISLSVTINGAVQFASSSIQSVGLGNGFSMTTLNTFSLNTNDYIEMVVSAADTGTLSANSSASLNVIQI